MKFHTIYLTFSKYDLLYCNTIESSFYFITLKRAESWQAYLSSLQERYASTVASTIGNTGFNFISPETKSQNFK